MIKRFIAALAAFTLLASTAGCVTVNFSHSAKDVVQGKGDMVSMSFDCGDFTKLIIKTDVELYYTAEKSDKVTIEIQENLVEYLEVSTNNGELLIDSEKDFNITDKNSTPKLYVSAPTLELLSVQGGIRIANADTIKSEALYLRISGACDGALDLEVKKLDTSISGAGDITFSGTADEARFDMSGAGSISALKLKTKSTDIKIAGAGTVTIDCSEKLNVEISGAGSVNYTGNAEVTKNGGGLGSISKID